METVFGPPLPSSWGSLEGKKEKPHGLLNHGIGGVRDLLSSIICHEKKHTGGNLVFWYQIGKGGKLF